MARDVVETAATVSLYPCNQSVRTRAASKTRVMERKKFTIKEGRMVRWCSKMDSSPSASAPTRLMTAFGMDALVLTAFGPDHTAMSATCIAPYIAYVICTNQTSIPAYV